MPNNALGLTALTDMSQKMKTVDKAFASAVRKNLRAGVAKAGGKVLAEVKSRASWSSRIPAATALTIRYKQDGASVRIQVNKGKVPHARAYEVGSKGAKGGTFRHPVFHKIGEPGGFANERTRPFFFSAIDAEKRGIDQEIEKVVIQTARDAGFN